MRHYRTGKPENFFLFYSGNEFLVRRCGPASYCKESIVENGKGKNITVFTGSWGKFV